MLEQEETTDRIIGAAIEVHKKLGPGFVESIYEAALCVELRKRSIPHARQMLVPVIYDGVEVGQHRLDLFVESEIVVELSRQIKRVIAPHCVPNFLPSLDKLVET